MSKLLLVLLLAAVPAVPQSSTGEITGQVTDDSGAGISDTRVTVRNTGTGESRDFRTDATGNYLVTQLIPGTYEVAVEKDGFRRFVRGGIILQVGQRARIDARLTIGAVTESVMVNAEAPQLETDEASLGQVVETRKILELPMNGRNIVGLAAVSPGVVPGSGFGGGIPNGRAALTQASTANIVVNGGLAAHNDVLIDGVPLAVCCQNQIAFLPSIDMTQEFRVRTNLYDAQYGRTSGGLVTFASRGGTNQFHGSAYEFLRNRNLDSNSFFNNLAGIPKAHFAFNQFGGRVGGPIRKDRTFFFFNFEGLENRRANFFTGNVPTQVQRDGQYTEAIYDPFSTRSQAGAFVRDAFPANRIPTSRFDPVAVNVMKLYPLPNTTGSNNFISNESASDKERQYTARIDHLISQRQRLFGRISIVNSDGNLPDYFRNIASPGVFNQRITNRNAVLDDTLTVSPTLILNFRYGYTRQFNFRVPRSLDTDATSFGWPASFSASRQFPTLPQLSLQGFLGQSSNSLFRRAGDVHDGAITVTKVMGAHFLKAGIDYRIYLTNWVNNGNAAGSFSFNTAFTRGPDAQRGAGGNAAASFLLGTPASGSLAIVEPFSSPNHYHALFVQDDIRLARNFTLNLGLRWEIERPRTERYDRLSFFDPSVASPVAGAVGLPNLKGALRFVDVDGNPKAQQDTDWNNLGPRVGFAWQAAPRTAVRGGYGITYVPITSRYELTSNQGFSSTTNMLTSSDGGITPAGAYRNPFPTGIVPPLGSKPGLASSIGESFSTLLRNDPVGYSQSWSLDIQRELTSDLLINAAYVGSKGTKLVAPINLNDLPSQYLSLGADLLSSVANPFRSIVTAGTLSAATVTRSQLLRPYPQYLGVSTRSDIASSIYHGLQARVNKRFRQGFSVLAAYTAGKVITDSTPFLVSFLDSAPGYQDSNNRKADRAISVQDIAQRFVLSYVWEMPLGRGRRVMGNAPRIVDAFIGGWQVNGITAFQTGQPVVITNSVATTSGASRPHSSGVSPRKEGPVDQRLSAYFNTATLLRPGPYEFGNLSRTLPDVREDGVRNFDLSLFKNFTIKENWMLQFRAEFFNIFNTPRFGAPGGAYGNPQFGIVSTQANDPRDVQLALKIIF